MVTSIEMKSESSSLATRVDSLRSRLANALKGKPHVIENVLIALFAKGHILLEDQPGLGKTTLAKALASGLGEEFARIQCTPDLLPSDITGFNIFNQKRQEFEFRHGPVFSEVLLADEINRATPRTQSALLEAMAERQVSIDNTRYTLAETFFVIATQNPIEQHGTYPLPEAQLDRFAMKLSVGYPAANDEIEMLTQAIVTGFSTSAATEPILEPGDLPTIQEEVARITVARNLHEYLIRFAERTRNHSRIHLGISPRGLLIWQRCAQASAWLASRTFVTPDDIQRVAAPVLLVRLGIDDPAPELIIQQIMEEIPVPISPASNERQKS